MAETCADPSSGGREAVTNVEALGSLIARSAARLAAAGIADPRREARILVGHALDLSADALLRMRRSSLVPTARTDALVGRRTSREPLALITGMQGFWSIDLAVSTATLIPRADTESVVEAALAASGETLPARVLDLGTGTGAILLALLVEWRDAFGVGVDRSEAACGLARRNARRLRLGARSGFVCGDWDAPLGGRALFDVVVSNPPYIRRGDIDALMPEVACFEPHLALDGGPDGLDAYRHLVGATSRLLAPGGVAVFEIGAGQARDVASLAAEAGLAPEGSRRDLGGHVRALSFRHA